MEEEKQVEKAKESFETILLNDKYSNIIKDDQHLQLLLSMLSLETGDTILDVGTGAGYLAFPLARSHPDCQVIGFYTEKELKGLFVEYGMQPLRSEITSMHFPFPKKREYLDLFETLSEEEKAMYQITEKDGVVWVGYIDVENLLLERRI